jgi:hypothetical protein
LLLLLLLLLLGRHARSGGIHICGAGGLALALS